MNRIEAMARGQAGADRKRLNELTKFDEDFRALIDRATALRLNRRVVRGLIRLREHAVRPLIEYYREEVPSG